MTYTVDFKNVSTTGLESSPIASSLAGLRANEARYFKNKYDVDFTVESGEDARDLVDYVAAESGLSASSCQSEWRSPTNWAHSSSPGRGPSWLAPSAVRSSWSRVSTDRVLPCWKRSRIAAHGKPRPISRHGA